MTVQPLGAVSVSWTLFKDVDPGFGRVVVAVNVEPGGATAGACSASGCLTTTDRRSGYAVDGHEDRRDARSDRRQNAGAADRGDAAIAARVTHLGVARDRRTSRRC